MTTNRNSPRTKRHTARGLSFTETLESRVLMAAAPAVPSPTDVVVTTVSEAGLNLTWADASTNETQFVVQRAGGGAPFTTIATLPADTTTFNDSGLIPLTKYRYRVQAGTGT